jgi:A/G-specific adenine glycosylase
MTRTNTASKENPIKARESRGQVLEWYACEARELPWRITPNQRTSTGELPNPYHVWLSEIMAQQTTLKAVIPYFLKFIDIWPSVHDLAAANQDNVMKEWAGLGYYARARNLYACAKVISTEYGGEFPKAQVELKTLPGIGDYTSAAIASIAFGEYAAVMDGNVERVMARLFDIHEPLPKSKPILKALTDQFFEEGDYNPGDLGQGLMDLGATVCTPKKPKCMLCPVHTRCDGYKAGTAEELPNKTKKKPRPKKMGYVYWAQNEAGQVWLERRDEKSMLGGMLGLPTSEWTIDKNADHLSNFTGKKLGSIFHTFTHFDLELVLVRVTGEIDTLPSHYSLYQTKDLEDAGFPSLFQKAYKAFISF